MRVSCECTALALAKKKHWRSQEVAYCQICKQKFPLNTYIFLGALIISFHFNSLFGHLVPYKHQRQVPNILEIILVATLVRAHTHAHTHTHKYTHTYTHMTVSAIVAGIDITQCTCNKVSYYDVHTLYISYTLLPHGWIKIFPSTVHGS